MKLHAVGFENVPHLYVMPALPDVGWLRPLFVIVLVGTLTVIALHAWVRGHIRRHGFPPLALFRLQQWRNRQ